MSGNNYTTPNPFSTPSSSSSRLPTPRRAHFSQHESDRFVSIDQALLHAAMADQAALQREQMIEPIQPFPSTPTSPFLPGYSLAVPSTSETSRTQMARSVSPLHTMPPNRGLTESPVFHEPFPVQSTGDFAIARPSPRRAEFVLSEEDESGIQEDEDEVTDPSWVSCRDRRPTAADITPRMESKDWTQEKYDVEKNDKSYDNKIPLHVNRKDRPAPLQEIGSGMPRRPTQAYQHYRVTSEGMFSPRDITPTAGGSIGSIHGSTPHVQHYDPLTSPSMVQPYSSRSVSASLKPALVRHDQSYKNMASTLGRGVQEEDHHNRHTHRLGIRNALAGLYDRVVSSDHKVQRQEEDEESRDIPTRPRMRRASSAQSIRRTNSDATAIEGDVPPLSHLSKRRQSMAFILGEDDEPKESDDPRFTGLGRKSMDMRKQYDFVENRRSSYTSEYCDAEVRPRARAMSLANTIVSLKKFGSNMEKRPKLVSNHSSLQSHMAERQKLILKFARALMLFGAPSHRVESQLNALSQVLDVDGQFIHFPGLVIASFGDIDNHTSECHFVKSKTELALGHLSEVHNLYKSVISDQLSVHDCTEELNRLLKAKPEWSILSRVAFNGIRCGIIAPMGFGGSFVDAFVAGAFGAGLTFTQLYFAGNNPMFSNVFEITAAIIISFISRMLSTKSVFCYEAIASAGLCLVLPGYIICELCRCGSEV
jgi:uncharacterized membrane protein YjjP (DUF1212 family)